MEKSYYICWDELGNRAVLQCEGGYPTRGVLLPESYPGTFESDIELLDGDDVPIGGMSLNAMACVRTMEWTDGIMKWDDAIEYGGELSDDEKRYLGIR